MTVVAILSRLSLRGAVWLVALAGCGAWAFFLGRVAASYL